jgi:hypothetical protein
MQHHFNVEIAKKFGVNIAIFLDHMAFWITKNIANEKHFYDGAYWTYNSIKAYLLIFNYFSADQMRKIIKDCEKFGLINIGNYNDNKYDRTSWYSLTEYSAKLLNISILSKPQMDFEETQNGFCENPKPIPCTNTVTNTKRESPARKKREPLSENFKPDQDRQTIAQGVSQRCNISIDDLLIKFKAIEKKKNKTSLNWQLEFELFLAREKPTNLKTLQPSKPNQEIRSTVKKYEPTYSGTPASIKTVNEHMQKIRQTLQGTVSNGRACKESANSAGTGSR